MRLFQRSTAPSLRPMEIPASFVSRLAAWLRYTTAVEFCREFELDFELISSGDAGGLQKLAELTMVDIAALRNGPVRERGGFSFGGHHLSTSQVDSFDLWICPECAKEDMAAASHLPPEAAISVRRDYLARAIGTCGVHGRRLVWLESTEWLSSRHDTSLLTTDVVYRLDDLLEESRMDAPSPIDTFVRRRLDGHASECSTLASLALSSVLRLSGRLGNLALNGGIPALHRMTRPEFNRVCSAGIKVLEGGGTAVEEVILSHTNGDIGVNSARLSLEALLPKVWDFVGVSDSVAGSAKSGDEPARTRSTLRLERRLREGSVKVVADRFGMGPPVTKALAEHAGALVPGQPTRIDGSALAEWLDAVGGVAPSWQIAKEIGATRTQMDELLLTGLLTSINDNDRRSYRWLRRADVQKLMSRFTDGAAAVTSIPAGKALIADAVRGFKGALPKVHSAILERTIWVGKLAGAPAYGSILVDRDQVYGLLQDAYAGETSEQESLSPMQFARKCGIGSVAGHALVVMKLVRGEVRLNKATGLKRMSIPVSEVSRFHAEFITGTALARSLRVQPRGVVALAATWGVKPIELRNVPITLFRRADIPDNQLA